MLNELIQDPAKGAIDSFNTGSIQIDTLKGIKPLKATVSFPYTNWELAGIALAVVLVLAFLFLLYIRIRKSRNLSVLPHRKTEPLKWAQEQLENLRMSPDYKNGDFYWYHKQVSEVIRKFMSMHLGIDAEHLTTQEAFLSLNSFNLSQALRDKLIRFFNQADLVKYAAYQADEAHSTELNSEAKDILLQLHTLSPPTQHV